MADGNVAEERKLRAPQRDPNPTAAAAGADWRIIKPEVAARRPYHKDIFTAKTSRNIPAPALIYLTTGRFGATRIADGSRQSKNGRESGVRGAKCKAERVRTG